MPPASNQRRFPRRKTRDVVRLDWGESSAEALMTDISATGVGLLLHPGETLPDVFSIHISPNLRRAARIVWRGYPRCGAVFQD